MNVHCKMCSRYDGVISIPGCDKNLPGCVIGMARVNRPSLLVYGGTILPGKSLCTGADLKTTESSF